MIAGRCLGQVFDLSAAQLRGLLQHPAETVQGKRFIQEQNAGSLGLLCQGRTMIGSHQNRGDLTMPTA